MPPIPYQVKGHWS